MRACVPACVGTYVRARVCVCVLEHACALSPRARVCVCVCARVRACIFNNENALYSYLKCTCLPCQYSVNSRPGRADWKPWPLTTYLHTLGKYIGRSNFFCDTYREVKLVSTIAVPINRDFSLLLAASSTK